MKNERPIIEPPPGIWVPLASALTWISFRHAALDATHLVTELLAEFELADDITARILLHTGWRELADLASVNEITVRGQPDGGSFERQLSTDELRNCRYYTWAADGDAYRGPYGPVGSSFMDCVETTSDGVEGGANFHRVFVNRAELIRHFPPPSPADRKRISARTTQRAAEEWLRTFFREQPSRSAARREILQKMWSEFELPKRRMQEIWNKVSAEFPDWRRAGRRPKNRSSEIDS